MVLVRTCVFLLVGVGLVCAAAQAQDPLTLEQAVALALQNNRSLQVETYEVSRATERIAIERTKLLPALSTYTLAGGLLTRPSLTFDPGIFGTYAATGPIPAAQSSVSPGRGFAAAVIGQATLPLTQRIRIFLTIKGLKDAARLETEVARERRAAIVNQVKHTYRDVQQAEAKMASAASAVSLYREALRVTEEYRKLQAVLEADVIDVKTRLARAELGQLQLSNGLESGKEQLNELMGRPIATPFTTDLLPEEKPLPLTLAEARAQATHRRPELAQARIRLSLAALDRKGKHLEAIPEVSLAVTYFTTLGLTGVLPSNVAAAGVQIKWDPWDWGKRHHEEIEKSYVQRQAELGVGETESRILREVGALYRKADEARRQLAVSRLSEEMARESLRVVRNKFAVQAALLKDVLQAEAMLADSEAQYHQALAEFWTARGDLDRAMGEEQ